MRLYQQMALAPTLKRAEGKHWGDVHNQFLYRMEPRRPRITEGHSVSYMLTTSNGSQQLPGEPDNHVMDELSARGPGARCLGLLALHRLLTEGFYWSSPSPPTPWLLFCLDSETRPPCFLKSNIWVPLGESDSLWFESKALVHVHQALLMNGHSPLLYGDRFLEKDLSYHQHILKRVPVNVGSPKSGASVGKYGTSSLAPKTSDHPGTLLLSLWDLR